MPSTVPPPQAETLLSQPLPTSRNPTHILSHRERASLPRSPPELQLFFPSCYLFASDPVTLDLCLYESRHSSIIPSVSCTHMQGRVSTQLPLLTPHLQKRWVLPSQIRRYALRSLRAPARMEWLTCEMVTLFHMSWRSERDSATPAGPGGN